MPVELLTNLGKATRQKQIFCIIEAESGLFDFVLLRPFTLRFSAGIEKFR